MNQNKHIPYQIDQMPEFVVDQLSSGILPAFLPVSFVYDQLQCTGVYHTQHYRPLSSIRQIEIKDLLTVFCLLLRTLAENEKHYVFGETYRIHQDTIYVDGLFSRVKLIFQPLERLCTTKEQLIALLESCKSMTSDEGRGYLDDMISFLEREDTGYISAIHHTETLQNEIYVCDIT